MLRAIAAASLLLLVGAPAAVALTDQEVFRDLRFNLINPGARSMALGGAFISLADDATAAQANPAGLGFLERSESFVEMRTVDSGATALRGNESIPTGVETFFATGTDIDDRLSPSFASAVTAYGRWSMGVSLQRLLEVDNSTLSSFAFEFPDATGVVLAEGAGRIAMDVTHVNVSVGVRVTDRLGVGGTLTLSCLEIESRVVNRIVDTAGALTDGHAVLVPTLDLATSIDDRDDDVVISFGVVYKEPNRWSLGAVYHRAPRFVVVQRIAPDPMQDLDNDGVVEPYDVFGVRARLGEAFANTFHLPDRFGVGASWLPFRRGRFHERVTLSMDVERIIYSNLMHGYLAGVNVSTAPDAVFEVDDGTDFHAGLELILFNDSNRLPPMALRAGYFSQADSTIQAVSTGAGAFTTPAVFRGRGRQDHGTIGLGVSLGDRFNFDVAADFSETDNEYVLSVIYRGP